MLDWAGVFVLVVTISGCLLGAYIAEKIEDWWHSL